MRIHSTIALAAMAVALASPQAVMAKTKQPSGLTTQEQLEMALQQIAQLQAQVNGMKTQMDQQTATQSQAAADAQAASTKADQAIAKADAASAQAAKPAALPDSVKWAADTKITGRMYFNASSVSADNAAGANVEKDGGFQIKRFYLGVDHKFDNTFSANLTMDVDNVVRAKSVTDSAANGTVQGFYIKKAYLQAKLDPALAVRLGVADMPWIPYAEGLYGYRHIEKTITDLDSYGTSADWGVHVLGDLADGLISYQLSAVDGAGYRSPQFTKTVDIEGRVSLKYKGFNAAVGGYTGKLGKDVQGAAAYRTAQRFNALVAYQDKIAGVPVTLGAEYFHAKNWKVAAAAPKDSAEGYSLFASVSPVKQWSLFGRYDWVKSNKDTAPLKKDHFYQAGIQFSPAKIVDLALVYKRDEGDGGIAIGNLASGQATRDEFGLYGQFRF